MKRFLLVLMFLLASGIVYCKTLYVEAPIDFPNTPVKVAIETLFLKTGAQYSFEVTDPPMSVYGNVTLYIRERHELDTVLALILKPKNLSFNVDASGIYHIKKKSNTPPVKIIAKQYSLTYITADEIANDENIKKLLTKNGVLTQGDGNEIIITNEPSVLQSFEKIIKIVDVPDHANKLEALKELLKVFYNLYFPKDVEKEETKKEQPMKYVEPPTSTFDTPIKIALESLFKDAKVSYVIDTPLDENMRTSDASIKKEDLTKKDGLEKALKRILEWKELTFSVDEKGVYHIQKKDTTSHKEIFIEPPIDFQDTPLKVSLESIFLNVAKFVIDVPDISEYGNVTMRITEKQEQKDVLTLILEPKGLTYWVDAIGVVHIIKKPVAPEKK